MEILIKNATLISMANNRDKIEENIDILINEDKIVDIGKNLRDTEFCKNRNIKIIDATNKVVMPGLINTHSHVPMSIFRETLDGYNLQDWLTQKIWPMEDKLTNEDVYYASLLSFIEMIETGCTTINDMYFMTEDIIKAMLDTGIRLQTTRCLTDIAGEEGGKLRLQEILYLIEKYSNNPLLTFNCGIHGLYTSSEKYVKECVEFAKNNNLNTHMHFCENKKEVEDIINSYGKNPTDVIEENFKNVPTLLAHAVELNEEDIKKLSLLNVSISHCPISNLKLGCGIAKVTEMKACGINVSLGTDGQGSGCSLDLFETMKLVPLLQKGISKNAKELPAYEVLEMATMNGAKALNMKNEIGSIETGKQADIIIVDMNRTVSKPQNDLISQIVYNTKGEDVLTTIVAGKVLMENRILNVHIDKNELFKKCDEIIQRIS